MIFKTFGNPADPVVLLLHGGGLSHWSVEPLVQLLSPDYFCITPIIDGHGEDGDTTFISINDSALKVIDYIEQNHGGSIHAICGLSIGAQITLEVLSLKEQICRFSIVESALTIPLRFKSLIELTTTMAYPLIKQKWYSRLQAKSLLLPSHMFESYYRDSCKISKESLRNIISSNSTYKLNENLNRTKAKVLILVGGRELKVMKQSSNLLQDLIPQSEKLVLPSYGHGELSQMHPDQYCEYFRKL